jgi:ATP-dependent phosphofructokinase / diphosphate-dependent phosphofructokinase
MCLADFPALRYYKSHYQQRRIFLRRIGVLTSGGDCAGLNAAIRAIVHCATFKYGWEVIGIRNGTMGLLRDPLDYQKIDIDYTNRYAADLLRRGGTILGSTTSGNPLAFVMPDGTVQDRSEELIRNYHHLNLDGLIAIGGDGSLKILQTLATKGKMNLVGIPKTIDNDIGLTEAIGFSSAIHVATEALDSLASTAASHDRFMILEVMGRDAGHIALYAGIAGGADVILIPEIPFHMDIIAKKITALLHSGRTHGLIVVAEAARPVGHEVFTKQASTGQEKYGGIGNFVGHKLFEMIGLDSRVTVLGHLQRGGKPIARDRVLASSFGVHAVELIAQKKFGQMVAWHNGDIVDVSIDEVLQHYNVVDINGTTIKTARGLGTCLGDAL